MEKEDMHVSTAIRAARGAGDVLERYFGENLEVNYKGKINVVTDVDRASQEVAINIILAAHPGHSILGEEGMNVEGDHEFKWIIDPLDGTVNYLHGYPYFCVSIALERRGEVAAGAVYNPISKDLFHAERGGGAYLNGRRIRISPNEKLIDSLLVTGFPYDVMERGRDYLIHFANFLQSAQAVRRDGAAALDLCYVAMGRFDGFWEFGLLPWDVAAGSLMVKEAGGEVSDFDGSPLNIYGGEIIASNGKIHRDMIDIIQAGFKNEGPFTW